MLILFKILLFPVTMALSIITAVCRFVCHFSGALLGIASGLVFIIALLGLILPVTKLPASMYVMMFTLAFVISPYGLPKLADWLIDKLDDLNITIRSI